MAILLHFRPALDSLVHRESPRRRLRAGQRLAARARVEPVGRHHLLRVRRGVSLRADRARHQVPLPRRRIHIQGKLKQLSVVLKQWKK